MTLVSFDAPRRNARPSAPADGYQPLKAALNTFKEWRKRRREQKALETLPFDLRKDLGWPSVDSPVPGRR